MLQDAEPDQSPPTAHELAREAFCMGVNYQELEEELEMNHPFTWEVVPEGTPHTEEALSELLDDLIDAATSTLN